MKKSSRVFLLWAVMWIIIGLPSYVLVDNLTKLAIIRAWMNLNLAPIIPSNHLQDSIPDNWNIQVWGGATAIYRLSDQSFVGERAMLLEPTNDLGVVSLEQTTSIPPTTQGISTVYAKGGTGALQILAVTGTGQQQSIGWVNIPASKTWQKYQAFFTIPTNANQIQIRLRARTPIWFDEAYAGVIAIDGGTGANLLDNSGFEQDGNTEEPLEWWQRRVQFASSPSKIDFQSSRLSYMNIQDMLQERYDNIAQRAQTSATPCFLIPEMTSWLIARGPEFEKTGGATAREKINQLMIKFAPDCPQPYAELAALYESHNAFWQAAEYYHLATIFSGNTVLSGRYAFQEGFISVRYLGDFERAIPALQHAEKFTGWEGSSWYLGASTYFLAQSLEAQGKVAEAITAYTRVVDCRQCIVHRPLAIERLNELKQ